MAYTLKNNEDGECYLYSTTIKKWEYSTTGIKTILKKWNKYWYVLQHRQTLETFCEIKEISHKRPYIYDSIYKKCPE